MTPKKNNISAKSGEELVFLLDDNKRFLDVAKRILKSSGFRNVELFYSQEESLERMKSTMPSVFLIDIHLKGEGDGLQFLQHIRNQGYDGIAVIVSADSSPEVFFRAARAGANDFFLKGPHVDFPTELKRLLNGSRGCANGGWQSTKVSELGYLRSFGLSGREIELLEAFAVDFPRHQALADRMGKAVAQVRKSISRIQDKLMVENLAQLARILTVCAMFDRDN